MSNATAYRALSAQRSRVYNLEHLQAIASWDRLTYMPRGSAAARAAAQAELGALIQSLQSAPELDKLLEQASRERLDADEQANLALMKRERAIAMAVPEALISRRVEAVGAASQAWAAAKSANRWEPFAEALGPLVDVVRETADRVGGALGLSRYDSLLDGFDRGLRRTTVETWFGEIGEWLPKMVESIIARQGDEPIAPRGSFAVEDQRAACVALMELLGFDFEGGRLDVSVHPFTGGTPEDVRLTTRFNEERCLPALLGIIHETGHGRYQAGLPARWRGQPLGEPCSAPMHEAQALLFERQLAPTPAFVRLLSAILKDKLGPQPAFEEANLQRVMTRVRPGKIRVEADEVTYPAHVILRTQIEAALIEGEIEVRDIPEVWDGKMQSLLGIDTMGDPVNGPLQDIHWSQGMFGYFPAYLIGAMVAAQLFQAFLGGEAAEFDADRPVPFRPLGDWLSAKVWSRGAMSTTEELVLDATGAPLSPAALRAHFQRRYLV